MSFLGQGGLYFLSAFVFYDLYIELKRYGYQAITIHIYIYHTLFLQITRSYIRLCRQWGGKRVYLYNTTKNSNQLDPFASKLRMCTVGWQPEDGNLIFLRSLCGYVWVNILSLSP